MPQIPAHRQDGLVLALGQLVAGASRKTPHPVIGMVWENKGDVATRAPELIKQVMVAP